MPSVICSRPEFKEGLHKSSHIYITFVFLASQCVLQIYNVWHQRVKIKVVDFYKVHAFHMW
jgi:hypothetical protein